MRYLFLTALALLIISSANAQLLAKRQPATQDNVMMLELQTKGNLEEILWYISAPIEIQREAEITSEMDVQKLIDTGKLKISGGKYIMLDVFPSSATGLIAYKEDNDIAIRFRNEDGKYLVFELTEPKGLENAAYYKLQVKNRDEDKLSGGTVEYGGDTWELISGSRAILEFKAKGNSGSNVKKTKVKGLRKDGTERGGLKVLKKKN